MTTSEGQVLRDRYRLERRLAAGGQGSVWLAEDQLLERKVALKELAQHITATDLKERRARALREARALARVKHPAIVQIYDFFLSGRNPWIVMDYISGRPLSAIINDHPLEDRQIAEIGLPVLRGLCEAHKVNVLHRDVKPANILVADDHSVFLVDFGIAKIADDIPLTGQYKVVGSLEYMAPERFSAHAVGPSADLWSLGVTLFYAMEGRSPFLRRGTGNDHATMWAIIRDDPPRPARTGMLADMVLRLLDKDPDRRACAAELEEVLRAIIGRPKTRPGRPPGRPPEVPPPRPPRHEQPELSQRRPPVPGNVREAIRDGGTRAGAALLLAMPDDDAAQVLADFPARNAGELLETMAALEPERTTAVLRILTAGKAGRAMNYLSPQSAASVVAIMRAADAVRILGHADVRTAADVIRTLRDEVSAQLIKSMKVKTAAAILGYVPPVTVAGLLRHTADEDLNMRLLQLLKPPFRAQVMLHL